MRPPLPDYKESLLLDIQDVDDDTAVRLYAYRDDVLCTDHARMLDLMHDIARSTVTDAAWDARLAELTPEVASQVARTVLLRCIDQRWRQHLAARRTRPWPFSPTNRSAWPQELTALRTREATAFDTLLSQIHQDATPYFFEVNVELT